MKAFIFIFLFLLPKEDHDSQTQYRGCFFKTAFARAGSVTTKYNLFVLPPNDPLHNVTIQEILNIQACFLVYPIFYFYDDSEGNNAFATDEVIQANGPDGTVIFGRRLFNREFIKTYGGTTIPIIMAHEYAHIVDYKFGALQHVGSKKTELFADFLAGSYMYWRVARGIPTDINACQRSFQSLGDTHFGNANSHGTAQERSDALMAGYNLCNSYIRAGRNLPLTVLIDEAKTYLESVDDSEDDVIVIK